MHILKTFRIADVLYSLCDDTANNDDRTVCRSGTTTPLLVFGHSLDIRKPDSTMVANMHSRAGRWRLAFNFEFHDLGPTNGHDWRALMAAEVRAAEIIIPTLDKG